jgi:type II secretory pathway pseudopilin PulG
VARIHIPDDDESGLAMIAALIVIMITTLLSLVAVQSSLHSLNTSSVDRKRVLSIEAAEGGLDLAFKALQSPSLPCTITGTLATSPTTASYTATINYFDTYPPSHPPLACPLGDGVFPVGALIKVVGSTSAAGYGQRAMESLVQLTATLGGFDKAIFANGALTFSNHDTVNGQSGSNADVYSNTDFTCSNNTVIHGTLYVQGSITQSNSCSEDGDVWAKNDLTASGNALIGHDAKSSQGNITLSSNTTVGHDAFAYGTISATGTVTNSRFPGDKTLGDPPSEAFPTLNFVASAWTAAGYTNQPPVNTDCTNDAASVYKLIESMATVPTKTVIQTTCPLSWSNHTVLTQNVDLAIFSTGGFTTNQNFSVASTDSKTHALYWIVPTSAGTLPTPCTSPGITTSNQTGFGTTTVPMQLFIYSPCNVSFNNNQSTSYGQIYGGSKVTIGDLFTFTFSLSVVPGGSGGGSPTAYQAAIAYKREVTP